MARWKDLMSGLGETDVLIQGWDRVVRSGDGRKGRPSYPKPQDV